MALHFLYPHSSRKRKTADHPVNHSVIQITKQYNYKGYDNRKNSVQTELFVSPILPAYQILSQTKELQRLRL